MYLMYLMSSFNLSHNSTYSVGSGDPELSDDTLQASDLAADPGSMMPP